MSSYPQHQNGQELDVTSSAASHLQASSDNHHASPKEDVEAAKPSSPALRFGEETFWSPQMKQHRFNYIRGIAVTTLMVSLLIWGVVSIYWGSVFRPIQESPNLTGWIINRDQGGTIGTSLQEAMLAANNGPLPHSTWSVVDPSLYPTTADIDYQVATQASVYIVMEIAANSTLRFEAARASGDASWDPRSIVSLTYATARNFQAVPAYVLNPAQSRLTQTINSLSVQLAREYFSSAPADAAINLARAPQTIASPIVVRLRDLRPYDTPVAIAVLVVGLIYLCILAFNITMANFGLRQPFQSFLTLRSLITMRLVAPICSYVIISLMISLLNIAFELPFGRTFTHGAGFMIWWATTFCGMTVMGLVTEAFLSLAGPPFMGFLLLSFIIINVSVANFPIEISPSFYKYGYAMPFYNIRMIYNTVIFNVGKHILILKYFGILWAWLVVIFATLPIWIWLERRKAIKARKTAGGPPGH